ncbi:MAG: type II secretion system F family protein [Lawsonibacter sp.]
MQTYKYSAISKDGAKVSGVIEAFDEFAAVATIKETCSVVTKIQAVEQQGLLTRDVFTPKIRERDLAVMCSQFAIILGAGLPMVRAVELIASQTEDRRLKELLNQVAGDVAGA